jgi:hypothetical protein
VLSGLECAHTRYRIRGRQFWSRHRFSAKSRGGDRILAASSTATAANEACGVLAKGIDQNQIEIRTVRTRQIREK